MRAVVAHAARDLRLEEREEETAPGEGHVLVRVAAGGICGSDLHYFHNGGFGTVRLREPMILGHEASGTVASLGKSVTGLAVGELVAINPSLPCGRCEECQRGLRNHCNDMLFRGSAMRFPHAQGLFREALLVPAHLLHPVGPDVSAGVAALAEPFAVCLHAVKQAGSLLGKTVLVSGCGPIGCLTIAVARLAGAQCVIACDVVSEPLKIAEKLGADEVTLNGPDASGLHSYKAGKGRIDVAFDCSGHPDAVMSAIECLRPRGTLVAVGLGGSMPFPLPCVVTKELHVVGSFRFDAEFGEAVDLIAQNRIDLSPLISHTYPLDRALEAFELAGDRSRAMKVQVDFQ